MRLTALLIILLLAGIAAAASFSAKPAGASIVCNPVLVPDSMKVKRIVKV